jgi:hypothetical protein
MKEPRDPFEGAIHLDEYLRSAAKKPRVKPGDAAKSQQRGVPYPVPKDERRSVKEQTVQNEIIKFMRMQGWYVVKYDAVRLVGSGDSLALGTMTKGVPDLIACINGSFVGIEVKAPRANVRQSPEQIDQGVRIEEAGGNYIVTHGVEDLEKKLWAVGL